jgi:pimeloyl-ACP methyl ester carboxylesterase
MTDTLISSDSFRAPIYGGPVLAESGELPAKSSFVSTASGERLRYVAGGAGAPVVLIHGALVTLEDMLLGPFDPLAEHYRVVAFDRPGHGLSERPRLQGSPWIQARMIHDGVVALGLERPVLVGHSFGGAVALAYALLFPDEVRSVVALAPIAFPEIRLEQVLFGPRAVPVSGDALAYSLGPVIDAALLPLLWEMMFKPQPMPERFRREFPFRLAGRPEGAQANGEDAAAMISSMSVAAGLYPTCRVPVQVIAGSADLVVSPDRHAKPLAWMLPRGELQIIPGLGHMLHHFAQDHVLNAVHKAHAAPARDDPRKLPFPT